MSYNKYEIDTEYFGTIPSRANSETLNKILLSPEYVYSEFENGADPISLSILKWHKIKESYNFITNQGWKSFYYGDIYHFIGSNTCALCLNAVKFYEKNHGCQKYAKEKCTVCELGKIEVCIEKDSLFSNITYLLGYIPPSRFGIPKIQIHKLDQKEIHCKLGILIDEMIERLVNLKDKEWMQ